LPTLAANFHRLYSAHCIFPTVATFLVCQADADDNEKLVGGELTPLDEDVEVGDEGENPEENYEVERIIQKRTRQVRLAWQHGVL
jgi:hypothetical protein